MLKKYLLTVAFILMCIVGIAQSNITDYKYIIVPKKFDFSKSEDQYQLNSLTKFLFNKYGYEAYFVDDDLPEDLKNERCLALTSEVSKEKGGIFKTKVNIVLKDCFGASVMTSKIGESRLKKFDKAYNEALRQAFETFQKLEYEYVATDKEMVVKSEKKTIILKENNVEKIVAVEVAVGKGVFTQKEKATSKEIAKNESEFSKTKEAELYYAETTTNGYQLANSDPKIVMVLLTTAAENVFIVKGKSAIVFKEDGFWYYSENDGKLGEKKRLDLKF